MFVHRALVHPAAPHPPTPHTLTPPNHPRRSVDLENVAIVDSVLQFAQNIGEGPPVSGASSRLALAHTVQRARSPGSTLSRAWRK